MRFHSNLVPLIPTVAAATAFAVASETSENIFLKRKKRSCGASALDRPADISEIVN